MRSPAVFHRTMKPRLAEIGLVLVLVGLALSALSGGGHHEMDEPLPPHGLVPHLRVDLRIRGGAQRLRPGQTVETGDVVQVSYAAAGNAYGVVVSVDGRGVVTLHSPRRVEDTPRIRSRGEVPLSHAFELDDAPAFERFFFVVTAAEPLDVAMVLRAANQLASAGVEPSRVQPLPLPEGMTQSSFLLRKSP